MLDNLYLQTSFPPVVNEVRLLLKMSIYDQSFEECKTRIEKYENSNLR